MSIFQFCCFFFFYLSLLIPTRIIERINRFFFEKNELKMRKYLLKNKRKQEKKKKVKESVNKIGRGMLVCCELFLGMLNSAKSSTVTPCKTFLYI